MSTCKDIPFFGTVVQTKEDLIRSLEIRIEEIKGDIRPLADEAARCRQQILELKSPFKVGDTIVWPHGKRYRKGKVVKIREWVCGDPEWRVQLIKSDGTFGAEVNVHPYFKPDKL